MDKEKAVNILDDMIKSIPIEMEYDKIIWCSHDIYKALEYKSYKGFKIITNELMPKKEYAVITKAFI